MMIFIAWIVFILSEQKKKKTLESHKKVRENKDYYNIGMLERHKNINL